MKLQYVCIGLNYGKRRFDFMPGIGDELLLAFYIFGNRCYGAAGEKNHKKKRKNPGEGTHSQCHNQSPENGSLLLPGIQEKIAAPH